MFRSNIILVVCILAAFCVLCTLGWWQVQRLQWKEALIERVEERVAKPPIELDEFLAHGMRDDDREYHPVIVEGEFDHSREVFELTTDKNGIAGWNIHTPLTLKNGKLLIVNRGFVPSEMRDAALRSEGQILGDHAITGLYRNTITEKPNSIIPDNELEKREFYWRSYTQMISLMGAEVNEQFLPFTLDAGEMPNKGGWPKGGTTRVSFPNNHLQYAITWFGLALALIVVGVFFMVSRQKALGSNS